LRPASCKSFATASEHERQQTIADYLRDDERQARTDLDIPD
jgi:hypothetical protein